MIFNALYHVINHIALNGTALPAGVKFVKQNNIKNYFIFDLPLNKPQVIGKYTLTEHHLSVFKNPVSEVDKKCQYHYTALFTNPAGKKFKLHVYYDGKDHCILKPHFSVEESANKFQAVSLEEYDEAFKALANYEIAPLISHLRAVQSKHFLALKVRFDDLERQVIALSIDLKTNKDKYLAILEQQLQVLEEQKLYINHSWDIIPQINALKKRRDNLSSTATGAAAVVAVEETLSQSDEMEARHATKDSKEKVNEKSPSKKTDMTQFIRKLKIRVNKFASIKKDEQPQYIADCHRDLLLLEVENPGTTILEELRSDVEEKGKKLLEEFLTAAKYDLATQLNGFYPLVGDQILNLGIALSAEKTELLYFLLKEKILPADYKNFNIKGSTYSSLMAYYFEANISTVAKIEGLKTLIKNGVSLMALDKTGFPYVARVLLQPNHSLHALFKENPDLTLFYRQFNAVLNMVAARADCTEEGKAQIKQLIKDNNKYLASIHTGKVINKLSHFTKAQSAAKPIETIKAQEVIAKLRADPAVSKLTDEIKKKTAYGLKTIKGRKAIHMQKNMALISMQGMEKLELDLVNMKDTVIPSYEIIKEIFVSQQHNVLVFLDLCDQVPDLDRQSKRSMGLKKAKVLGGEYDELIKQMKEVQEKLSQPYSKLLLTHLEPIFLNLLQNLITARSSSNSDLQLFKEIANKASVATAAATAGASSSPTPPNADHKATFSL